MAFFGDDNDEIFDFFIMDGLSKRGKNSGGCMLCLLMIIVPVLAIAGLLMKA